MKPITISEVQGGYAINVNWQVAQAYGCKKRKLPVNGNVCKHRDGVGLDIVPGRVPEPFDLETAKSLAHQIGRYMLGFGDLVFAYTDAPEGAFK